MLKRYDWERPPEGGTKAAVYDRRVGLARPIAMAATVDDAVRICEALNRSETQR